MRGSALSSGVMLLHTALGSADYLDIPASGKWDGVDGPWSSFAVRLGDQRQEVRLLPSFFGITLAPINADSCNGTATPCPADLGLSYDTGSSTTWTPIVSGEGPALLGTANSDWFYDANSTYGRDKLSIEDANGSIRTLTNASFVTPISGLENLSTGILGLSNRSLVLEEIPLKSFITQLQQQRIIRNTAWFYTAGSKEMNVSGALVLGGYDRTRMDPKPKLTISSRNTGDWKSYYLYLNGINDGGDLLDRPTRVRLNSDVPQIWLPNSTCRNFEIAYGLVWNETYQYYLLDETQHARLKKQNSSLKFTLSPNEGYSNTIVIEVPYYAMDLRVVINGTSHYYFPIRWTQFTEKYVLGRAFFQVAYMMVNHDNGSFEIGQTRLPGPGEAPRLQSISPEQPQSQGRSTGGIVGGTIVGSTIVVAIIGFIIWRRRMRTRKRQQSCLAESATRTSPKLLHESHKAELAATPSVPPPAYRKRLWSNATTMSEVDGIDTMLTSRLDCLREELNEAPEKLTPEEPFMPPVELEGSTLSPAELDAGFRGFEWVQRATAAQERDEATTILDVNQDEVALPPSGACTVEHDEPVSPLASRSESRASKRDAKVTSDSLD